MILKSVEFMIYDLWPFEFIILFWFVYVSFETGQCIYELCHKDLQKFGTLKWNEKVFSG